MKKLLTPSNLLFLKRNKYWLLWLLAMLTGQWLYAQQSSGFATLSLPGFAKMAALGGVNASLYSRGYGMYLYNPALLTSETSGHLAATYALLPAGAGLSSVHYNFEVGQLGAFGAGLQYVGYGSIPAYDITGAPAGTFRASDLVMSLAHARQAGNFRFGAGLKFAHTAISGYSASALMLDIGGLFVHPDKDFTVGLSIRNFGFVVNDFTTAGGTTLPFDVQAGTSFKPAHMPVRFSITLHKLQEWDLLLPGETTTGLNAVLDNFFRHVVLGAEVLVHKNVSLLAGYNRLRRAELQPAGGGSFSGFSVGTEITTSAFVFTYAFGGYNVAGNTNTFTLGANLATLITRK